MVSNTSSRLNCVVNNAPTSCSVCERSNSDRLASKRRAFCIAFAACLAIFFRKLRSSSENGPSAVLSRHKPITPITFSATIKGAKIMASRSSSSSGVPGTCTMRESWRGSFMISAFPVLATFPVIPSPSLIIVPRCFSAYLPSATSVGMLPSSSSRRMVAVRACSNDCARVAIRSRTCCSIKGS